MTTHLFIFAGEMSGDLHGGCLIEALRNVVPSLRLSGVGGPSMRAQGMSCLLNMEEFQVFGFTGIIKAFPRLIRHFYTVLNAILDTKPDCVILIDFPGFNLRLAKKLRQKGYQGKIVQYVCPTIWAHGKNRIHTMLKTLDLLLAIFPFEPRYFTETPLKVVYIGHPLIHHIGSHPYDSQWAENAGLPSTDNLIAIFPGSRVSEIKQILPLHLEVADLIKKKHPGIKFGLSVSHSDLLPAINQEIKKSCLELGKDLFLVQKEHRYELMKNCKTALAKSGTVTLELALHGCPSVVVYQLSLFNYMIAKYILRINMPYFCMANILASRELFPEIIGRALKPDRIYKHLEKIHNDACIRESVVKGCAELKQSFGTNYPQDMAARAIVELLK